MISLYVIFAILLSLKNMIKYNPIKHDVIKIIITCYLITFLSNKNWLIKLNMLLVQYAYLTDEKYDVFI